MYKYIFITFILSFTHQSIAGDLANPSEPDAVQRAVAFYNPFKRCSPKMARAAIKSFVRDKKEVKKRTRISVILDKKLTVDFKKIHPKKKDLRVYNVLYTNSDGKKCDGSMESQKSILGGCKTTDGIFVCY